MRYISDDNKVFNTEQECLNYEKSLATEKEKKEKLLAEKEQRLTEIRGVYKEFLDLYQKYREDYHEPIVFGRDIGVDTNMFDRLFPLTFRRL